MPRFVLTDDAKKVLGKVLALEAANRRLSPQVALAEAAAATQEELQALLKARIDGLKTANSDEIKALDDLDSVLTKL